MRGRPIARTVLLAGLLSLLAAMLVSAVAVPTIEWYVIASGGGRGEGDGYALSATIGQAVAGVVSAEPYVLCAGFECRAELISRVYMPLVLRQ
jgi:hypothetical protein